MRDTATYPEAIFRKINICHYVNQGAIGGKTDGDCGGAY
jgi:hypothetical protein